MNSVETSSTGHYSVQLFCQNNYYIQGPTKLFKGYTCKL